LLELLFGVLEFLVLGTSAQVKHLNESLKVFRLGVNVLQKFGGEELLVVELSDLVLIVLNCASILVPLHVIHLLENFHFLLAVLGLRKLRSLRHIEGK
jgi:hypothetical protein